MGKLISKFDGLCHKIDGLLVFTRKIENKTHSLCSIKFCILNNMVVERWCRGYSGRYKMEATQLYRVEAIYGEGRLHEPMHSW